MAFAVVQIAGGNGGTGATVFNSITATGLNNLLVVHVGVVFGETCTGVTDDKGNTYVLSTAVTIAGARLIYQAYAVQAIAGATLYTASFSGSTVAKIIGAEEYSGGATSNAAVFDAQTTGTGVGTAVAASTLTAAATGELMVSTMGVSVATAYTAGTGYTLASGGSILHSQYKLSGGATETAPATLGGSRTWATLLNAYKPLATGLPFAMQYGLQSGQAGALSGTHR